jgi:hypothetical protein
MDNSDIVLTLINIIAGAALSSHYRKGQPPWLTVLATVGWGWLNHWIYMHLVYRQDWSGPRAFVTIIVGWISLFCMFFTLIALTR